MPRLTRACGTALVIVVLSACLQKSIFPLITPDTSTFDPAVVGEWRCGREVWTIAERRKDERRAYSVQIAESGQTAEMLAWLGRLGDAAFIDFILEDFPVGEPDIVNGFVSWHVVVAHTFGRVSVEGDVLRLRMLSMEWVEKFAKSQGPSFGHERGGDDFLLTAPTAELRQVVTRFADDEEAFPVQVELVRSPGDPARGKCYGER